MKYIILVDTSTDSGNIGLCRDGQLIVLRTSNGDRNHAKTINILIDQVIIEGGIKLGDIDAISVCSGPGSYTGLRIGMATAKGICFALDKPLLPIDRLTLVACQAFYKFDCIYDRYVALIKAREKEYFVSVFDNKFMNVETPRHIMENELNQMILNDEKTLIVTDLDEPEVNKLNLKKAHKEFDVKTDLFSWAKFVFSPLLESKNVDFNDLEPLYLKQVFLHK